MAMFGQFTKRAQQAIELARQAAVKENQPFVGTVHILLGLLLAGGNYPEEILNKVSIPYLQQVIHGLHTNLELPQTPVKQLAMTPNARRLLELSVRESRLLGQAFVGPELLLLALVKPPRPFAATTVLQRCGVDLSAAAAYLKAAATGQRLDPAASGAGEAAKPEDDAKENTQKGTPSSQNQPPVPPMRTNQPVVPPASPAGQRPQGKRAPSVLEQYGRDLTESARQGLLDPVIGREMEIQRIVQILIRRTKNNPVLIGEPGVGKSSVVEGLAQRIVTGAVPEMLLGKRVISLDLSGMVAGTKYRGEFEERLKNAMAEIRRAGDVLLFVDEVHTLVGAGSAEGSMDAANILKPAMARGEVQCIGATTLDEYRKHIEKDAALERRFQPVNVGEPTAEETLAILHGLRERYESHHSVRITDEALESAVQLAGRYIPDRFQPDKAIDLMDEACSRVRIAAFTTPPDLRAQEKELESIEIEKKSAADRQDFEAAAALRDRKRALTEEIDRRRAEWSAKQSGAPGEVTAEDIAAVVSGWTGIPVTQMTQSEIDRLLHLEDVLHERVIGQQEAISAVARAIRRARAGLKDPKRPIGSFIFLGPTGVGKTELCRALGEAMFGDENAVIRVDMSEFMDKYNVSRLVGSAPGYVGYEEGGQLTEAVRRKPYSVVLLDEVEKAHPDVFNIFLQILEDGRLTDGSGRVVSFKNTIVVMTSNAGAHAIASTRSMGFGAPTIADERSYSALRDSVMKAVKDVFRPEFINRVDEMIVFHPLSEENIREIAGMMLGQVAGRLKERAIHMTWDEAVEEKLSREGYDPKYGARPLRRLIQRTVEDLLSEELLAGRIALGDTVRLVLEEDKVTVVKPEEPAPEAEPAPAAEVAEKDAPVELPVPKKPRTRKAKTETAQKGTPDDAPVPKKPRARKAKAEDARPDTPEAPKKPRPRKTKNDAE